MPRQRPVVVSTRMQPDEQLVVMALATLAGVSVAEMVHQLVLPAARERLAEITRKPDED